MLSKKHLAEAALSEVVPGRILQVRATFKASGLPITVVGVYQHVWRTSLTTVQNLELMRLESHLSGHAAYSPAPSPHANLTPQYPHVGGAATRLPASNHSPELQQMLVDGDLCALNTWLGMHPVATPTSHPLTRVR